MSETVERLRRSADVRAALRGRRAVGPHVVVHARRQEPAARTRVAVVASRRVGNAVARNRAKRVIREAARHCAWRGGHDVVIVARGRATTSPMDIVKIELDGLLGQLDLRAVG